MTWWRRILARLTWPAVGILAGALVVLAGEWRAHRQAQVVIARPTVAPPTRLEVRSEVVYLPCEAAPGGQLQVLDPSPRDRDRLAATYGRPDLAPESPQSHDLAEADPDTARQDDRPSLASAAIAAAILGERELPKLPAGGTALLTLERAGRVDLTVKPHREPVFDLRNSWSLGGALPITKGPTRGRIWAAVDPVRWGRVNVGLEAGADMRRDETEFYGLVRATFSPSR